MHSHWFFLAVFVAAVAIPHAIATAVRCWRLRRNIDWSVVRSFGVLSAAGGASIAVATVGVLIGTVWGEDVLLRISVDRYRKVVSVLIGLFGVWLISGVL